MISETAAAPFLSTERFDLFKPAPGDLDDMVRLHEGEDMMRFLGPARHTKANQFERLLRGAGSWALYGYGMLFARPRGEAQVVASCGLFHSWRGFGKGLDDVAEAGWIVRQDWWGKGVAVEVMLAALAAFDATHGPRRAACMIEEGNTASERVAAKLGFVCYAQHKLEDGDEALLNLFERVRN